MSLFALESLSYDSSTTVSREQVLKNGVEVKLQRNALSVLESPTGNEDYDDNIDCDHSFCSSSDVVDKDLDYCKL